MACPGCKAPTKSATLLGVLGALRWFRCRACGIDFSRPARRRK